MAVRSTMLVLVDFVRRKIGDPDNGSPHFDTQEVQDALDAVRLDVFNEPLRLNIERTASTLLYKRYSSRHGFYEPDYTLLYANLQPATPDVAEVMRPDALWTFNHDEVGNPLPATPFPPIWLQYGKSYDVYRVAADLLEQWVLDDATLNVDFSAQGSSFHLSQITDLRERRIASYRMKQRAESVSARRTDAASAMQQQRDAKIGPVSEGVPFITGP